MLIGEFYVDQCNLRWRWSLVVVDGLDPEWIKRSMTGSVCLKLHFSV